jgi:glycosyltransferase involved in cell wall biosynthesis
MASEELDALVSSVACTVVPLRFGAGVKGKVVSAMAQGSPVVSTSVGMQGIPDPESVAFVGDTPRELAAAVLQCLRDKNLARQKAEKALNLVRQSYSTKAMEYVFSRVVSEAKERANQR